MYTSEILAIMGLLFSSYVFYRYARKVNSEELTLNGFMCADGKLNKNQFSNTFAASSFSLGMTVMYLMGNAAYLGWFLLVSPATYLIGHYLFIYLVKEANFDIKNCRTLSDIVYLIFPSKKIAFLITAMTLSSYVMLVFIELYIGSVLFSFFLPESTLYQTIAFLLIGMLVLSYVRLGGYKAIVQTDKWQLFLMISAMGAICCYGVIAPVKNEANLSQIIINTTSYSADNWFVFIFIIWLTLINSVIGITQITNWQRVAATESAEVSLRGMVNSSWKVLSLLLLTIIGFILVNAKGYQIQSLSHYLTLVKTSGGISSYLLFPVMIVGMASMVFSSADVALIAIGYTLTDQNSLFKYFSSINEKKLRSVLTIGTLVMLGILSIIFYMQFSGLQQWLLPLMYTTCGQLIVLCPIPIYVLMKMKRNEEFYPVAVNSKNIFLMFLGIISAWMLLFVGAYLSKITGDQLYALMAMPIGGIIVFISVMMVKNDVFYAENLLRRRA